MITILDGNAFYLRITGKTKVGEYEATLDLEAIDSLIVNFVRRVRESQTVTHDQGKVLAYNDGKLAKGVYGVEMVGYYNGQPWRFYAPEVFEIADDGETEASNVIGSVNVYDVTFYMKLGGDGVTPGYVDAAVTMHNTSEEAHTDMREAITGLRTKVKDRITDVMVVGRDGSEASMSEYDGQGNKVVKLPQDSMGKVDGVSVNGEELEVDDNGKVDITIPQSVTDLEDADEYATKEDAQAMVDEAKVTGATMDYQEDGGSPSATVDFSEGSLGFTLKNMKMKFSELSPEEIAAITGPQGIPGEGAIWTGQGEEIMTLEQKTGNAIGKAMSQDAVTKQVTVIKDTITAEQIEALGMSRYIYNNTWYATSGGNDGRLVNISAYKGRMISIVSNENLGAEIAFFSTDPVNSQTVPYCAGTSYVNNLNAGDTYSAVVPNDCKYLFVRHQRSYNNYTPASVNFYESLKEKVSALVSDNTAIHAEISAVDKKTRVDLQEYTYAAINAMNVYWYITNNVWTKTNINNNGRSISFAEYAGKKIEVVTGDKQTHIAFLQTLPTNANTPADYCDETELITLSENTTTVFDVPSDCNYFYVRSKYDGQIWTPSKITVFSQVADEVKEMSSDKPSLIYLSKDGNDDNDGKTSSTPKATFAAAMNAGGKDLKIILLSDLRETINLSSWNGRKSHVEIMGRHGAMSRIIRGTFLADLEPYEGYDDVYTWTPAGGNSIIPPSTYTRAWLWQHEIPDASTLIPANERHPLQRGRTYRRLSTCLKRAGSLESLLASESPCWYGDYTNNVLYLRAVAGSDVTENPIVVPSANGIAIQGGNYPITIVNVEAWYGSIVTSNNFVAKDCAARYNMYEGAWEIDNCKSVYLERCEADSNTMPGTDTGDGFNLHPTHNSGDDPLAKAGTHTLVDCWSHDNRDDGYSDHGKSEGTIIGGLYEHNGKAGLVPAYGSHDTIYNTTCQKNSRGITCLGGQTQDGGNGTQVACYGCVCDSNYYNFSAQGLQGEQVRFILNNCISRNATNTAIIAEQYVEVVVRDCTDSGSPTVKSASSGAVITIDNGNLIS